MPEKIRSTSQFEAKIIIELTEEEARALNAIRTYGVEAFLECFYKNLGRSALQPHEQGLSSLFYTIESELPKHLNKIDDVRDVWKGNKIVMPKSLNKD